MAGRTQKELTDLKHETNNKQLCADKKQTSLLHLFSLLWHRRKRDRVMSFATFPFVSDRGDVGVEGKHKKRPARRKQICSLLIEAFVWIVCDVAFSSFAQKSPSTDMNERV
jgi:hypothetical protein